MSTPETQRARQSKRARPEESGEKQCVGLPCLSGLSILAVSDDTTSDSDDDDDKDATYSYHTESTSDSDDDYDPNDGNSNHTDTHSDEDDGDDTMHRHSDTDDFICDSDDDDDGSSNHTISMKDLDVDMVKVHLNLAGMQPARRLVVTKVLVAELGGTVSLTSTKFIANGTPSRMRNMQLCLTDGRVKLFTRVEHKEDIIVAIRHSKPKIALKGHPNPNVFVSEENSMNTTRFVEALFQAGVRELMLFVFGQKAPFELEVAKWAPLRTLKERRSMEHPDDFILRMDVGYHMPIFPESDDDALPNGMNYIILVRSSRMTKHGDRKWPAYMLLNDADFQPDNYSDGYGWLKHEYPRERRLKDNLQYEDPFDHYKDSGGALRLGQFSTFAMKAASTTPQRILSACAILHERPVHAAVLTKTLFRTSWTALKYGKLQRLGGALLASSAIARKRSSLVRSFSSRTRCSS